MMKNLISLLLAVCLVMTLAGAFADANTEVYESAYGAGDNG